MHFLFGTVLSAMMAALPLIFQFDITRPPTALTGWLVFVISLGGVLSLINIMMAKFVLNPAIMAALKDVPSRIEFDAHKESNNRFEDRMESFVERFEGVVMEKRTQARRRGDPQ